MTDPDEVLPVRFERGQTDGRIPVLADGDPFTAYRYGDPELRKPVLFPVRSPSGDPVTRGYPLETRPEDRRDHPHQVGNWLTYGDVNGIDFWNSSGEAAQSRADELGTVHHREVTTAEDSEDGEAAELGVRCEWCRPDGSTLVEETTRFQFRAHPGVRIIDRTTTLAPEGEAVTFSDDKEGLFGLRVARSLELPVDEEQVFVDTSGHETVVTATGDHEVTGTYRSSTGATDADAWGARSEWMALTGTVAGESVTVTLFDHPDNPGFPTYWMARPYGLFAANPLGRAAFDDETSPMNFTIGVGESATFRYRIVVQEGDWYPLEAAHAQFAETG